MSSKQPKPPPEGVKRPKAPPAPPKRPLQTIQTMHAGPFMVRWSSDEPDKLFIRREGREGTFTLDTTLTP